MLLNPLIKFNLAVIYFLCRLLTLEVGTIHYTGNVCLLSTSSPGTVLGRSGGRTTNVLIDSEPSNKSTLIQIGTFFPGVHFGIAEGGGGQISEVVDGAG